MELWTPEQVDWLLAHRDQKNWAQQAKEFNEEFGTERTSESLRIKLRKLRKKVWESEDPNDVLVQLGLGDYIKDGIPLRIVSPKKREGDTLPESEELYMVDGSIPINEDLLVDRIIETSLDLQAAIRAVDPYQAEAEVNIPEEGWFGVVFSGDWHLGAIGSDMAKLVADLQLIERTPHVYYAFCGDAGDNFIAAGPHPGGIHEALLTPRISRKVIARVFKYVGSKLLAIATGCHDRWAIDTADYNLLEDIHKAHPNAAYLGYGGKVSFQCKGGFTFRVVLRHKGQGTSIYNMFHPCMRELHFQNGSADIVAVAHNHQSGVAVLPILGKVRCLMRTGTYKAYDRFANQLGFDEDRYHTIIPMVLLNGTTGEMQEAMGIQMGINMLAGLNSKGRTELCPT